MDEPLDDYPLRTDDYAVRAEYDGYPFSRSIKEPWRWWAGAAALVLIGAAVAGALLFLRRPAAPPSVLATEVAVSGTARTQGPLGPQIEPQPLPPLDLTDPLVRDLLGALSSRPELAKWLAGAGLIRAFVASVENIADGRTPASHLRPLAPSRPFVAAPRGDGFVVDPRSYARYDAVADTVASLDASGLARIYATLRPRLQEAYRELGYPDGNIDVAIERAIERLLRTPRVEPTARIQQAPVVYKFTDERLESLSPVEKQFLRMGPRNTRLVQDKLRDVGRVLGIVAERLQ